MSRSLNRSFSIDESDVLKDETFVEVKLHGCASTMMAL